MFQKFFTDTLMSRFIKSLLAQTPLFNYDTVAEGDYIIEDHFYILDQFIIKCVRSGKLYLDGTPIGTLYPSMTLYPSLFLFPDTGIQVAAFTVISYANVHDPRVAQTYISDTNAYDSETHRKLGEYLRHLSKTTDLNLMPFYNCYCGQLLSDVHLSVADSTHGVNITKVSRARQKMVAVPIKLGRRYRIAIDCPTSVLMRACVHDTNSFIDETTFKTSASEIRDLTKHEEDCNNFAEHLANSGKIFSRLQFVDPVTYVFESDTRIAASLQKDLYLVIQLPLNNTSSIVVLEDVELQQGVTCDKNGVLIQNYVRPALLDKNHYETYAFSDRLVEYLLGNVIHSEDPISENISKIQNSLARLYPDYRNALLRRIKHEGIFDSDIQRLVFATVNAGPDYLKLDQDGNINKDVETLLKLDRSTY